MNHRVLYKSKCIENAVIPDMVKSNKYSVVTYMVHQAMPTIHPALCRVWDW